MRSGAYAELWGVVDGAVSDALNTHPDYLTPKGQRSARASITKRVTGTVMGFAVQAAGGRTNHPAETSDGTFVSPRTGEGGSTPSPHHCRIGRVTFKRHKSSRRLVEFNDTTNRLLRARLHQKALNTIAGQA